MSNESFAEHLTVSARTVANWRGNPDVVPRPAIQDLLDAALERAPDRVKAQFALLIGESEASNQDAGHLESSPPFREIFWNLRDQLGTGGYDPRLERDLHSAAGELAEVVGWLAYDAEAHDLCRRMNQESLYFTRLEY